MDFSFTEDQEALREQLHRTLSVEIGTVEARRVLDGHSDYSGTTWTALKDLGVLGIEFDEGFGGMGLSPMFTCVTMQELGRVNAAVPFSSLYIVAQVILRAGTDRQRAALLPGLLSGDVIATWAVAEGSLPTGAADILVRHGNDGVHGVKMPVVDAAIAQHFMVLSRHTSGAVQMVLVDAADPGVHVRPLNGIDPSRPIAQIEFDGAAFEVLAGDGFETWNEVLNRAVILSSWEQIGGAEAMLDMARDYVMQRKAFGRTVASYQAVKHKLADMFVKIAMARANALFAAKSMEVDGTDLTVPAATARLSASDAFSHCAKEGLHLHGGLGVTWEGDPNLYYRRSRFAELQFESRRWTTTLVRELARQRQKELSDVEV